MHTLTGDTDGPPARDIVRVTVIAADSVDIDINSTAAENDDISLLNVPTVNGGFKQKLRRVLQQALSDVRRGDSWQRLMPCPRRLTRPSYHGKLSPA